MDAGGGIITGDDSEVGLKGDKHTLEKEERSRPAIDATGALKGFLPAQWGGDEDLDDPIWTSTASGTLGYQLDCEWQRVRCNPSMMD